MKSLKFIMAAAAVALFMTSCGNKGVKGGDNVDFQNKKWYLNEIELDKSLTEESEIWELPENAKYDDVIVYAPIEVQVDLESDIDVSDYVPFAEALLGTDIPDLTSDYLSIALTIALSQNVYDTGFLFDEKTNYVLAVFEGEVEDESPMLYELKEDDRVRLYLTEEEADYLMDEISYELDLDDQTLSLIENILTSGLTLDYTSSSTDLKISLSSEDVMELLDLAIAYIDTLPKVTLEDLMENDELMTLYIIHTLADVIEEKVEGITLILNLDSEYKPSSY